MAGFNLFSPKTAGTVSITCSTGTARVALVILGGRQVRVKNIDTTNVAFIEFGNATVTATLPNGATPGSMPIGPGETAGFTVNQDTSNVAAICSAGTPIVYFTPGDGF